MKSKKKPFIAYVSFLLLVVSALVGLRLTKNAITLLNPSAPRHYSSLEEAAHFVAERHLRYPNYFPQYLAWPPTEIYAQLSPHFSSVMHFKRVGRDKIILSVAQYDTNNKNPIPSLISPKRITSTNQEKIKGISATILSGATESGERCFSISWRESRYSYTVTAKDSLPELHRMVESMIFKPE